MRQTTICIIRGLQRLRQNLSVPILGIVGTAVLGAITGSVFTICNLTLAASIAVEH